MATERSLGRVSMSLKTQPFDYTSYPVPIRDDLPMAFRSVWQTIAQPGNWFTAEDRVSIAAEVRVARRCKLCELRKDALSPNAVDGEHACESNLPAPVIDAVHRITNDASRLSEGFLSQFYEQGFTDGHYVELLGIVVALVSIDSFHKALGIEDERLPQPIAGLPDGYRPPGALDSGAWVPTVSPDDLTSEEADIYGGMPQAGNVASAMSLVPDSVRMLVTLSNAQYLPMTLVPNPESNGGRALDRAQIELVAGRVSSINECFY